MKKLIIFLFVLFPLVTDGQNCDIVRFIDSITWQEILQRAKTENKLVFVDAYTTWCGPCKAMDRNIYTNSAVAAYMNPKFLCIKLQMDSTNEDLANTRRSYIDAFRIKQEYKISSFPSFLFFSSEGQLIERDFGYLDKDEFLELLQRAANPEENYAGKLKDFKNGSLPKDQWIKLAVVAKKNKNDSLAFVIAKSFKIKFIDGQQPIEVLISQFPDYLVPFSDLLSFADPIISYMYYNPKKADSLMKTNSGLSKSFVNFLINRDFIYPKIWPNDIAIEDEPNWKDIQKVVASKFDPNTAKKLILDSKIIWFNQKKDWSQVVRYEIERLDYNGIDTTGMGAFAINNLVFDVIFKHSKDPTALKRGVYYMEMILKNDPNSHYKIDTYSNILYKAGYKRQAIKQEQKALVIARKEKDSRSVRLYEETIDKMKQGKPTWN